MGLIGLHIRVDRSLYIDVHALHKLISSVYGFIVDCSLRNLNERKRKNRFQFQKFLSGEQKKDN